MALHLWTMTEMRWNRKAVSLVRPKMPTSGGPNKLKISPPLRWLDPRSQSRPDKNKYVRLSSWYLSFFNFAALSDAAPATKLVSAKCEWASVSGTVASQARHFPSSQLTKVQPSGRPSPERMRPTGSLVEGMPALTKALWIASFSWAWRVCLPALLRQDNPWLPLASTNAPQGQLWGEQRFAPSLRPTATRTASLSMRSPHAVMGHAWSQSPLWTPVTQAVEPCYIDQCELSANGLDSSQLMPCPKSSAWSASLPLGSGHHVCQSKLIEPDLAPCQERPPRVEEVGSGGQVWLQQKLKKQKVLAEPHS